MTAMDFILNADEVRVLGALIEKEITTPEYYPLSLNALINACNQKSNRFPVVSYDETIMPALVDGLREKKLIAMVTGATSAVSRVPKYRQLLGEVIGLDEKDKAVMCELMVRGPQTAAQLRSRGERLYKFADLADTEATLQGLMTREKPLVTKLPRQTGHKECRYAHLLTGQPVLPEGAEPAPEVSVQARVEQEQVDQLKTELEALRADLNTLRQQFEDFKKGSPLEHGLPEA